MMIPGPSPNLGVANNVPIGNKGTSSTGAIVGNSDSGVRIHNNDPSTRNQSQGQYVPAYVRGDELSSQLFDARFAQELFSRSQLQDEEILLLHKQIADASAKELQLLREKHVLERKLVDLQMALDEKHNNVVSDAIKDLTVRKGYLEENLRLADELKVMDDELFIFTSSLLSLLAEYGIRPPIIDALSISNGTKRLYHQLHWKIKASHVLNSYEYLQPNQHSHDISMESPSNQSRFVRDHDVMDLKDSNTFAGMEVHYPSPTNKSRDAAEMLEEKPHEMHRTSSFTFNIPTKPRTSTSYDSEGEVLPGIEGFQVIGDARPGSILRACGFPINGTSLCIFQWVRHLQNGTLHYIEGASNPDYVVTADDVDMLIAVECVPMDDNGRQGDLVRHFANNHKKITCEPEMQHDIQRHLSAGQAQFNVLLLKDPSEVWEPATLILKNSVYQVKFNHMEIVVIEEKYSAVSIKVPYGLSTQFVLTSSNGTSHPFSTNGTSRPLSNDNDVRLRDIIVLTMRMFQSKALDDKKKGKA